MPTYNIVCLANAIAPVTHDKGVEGNQSIVAREPIATPGGVQNVPCLSGNQIRHVMVRAPGWRWLIDLYGLAGSLTLKQIDFMMHGGSLTAGGPQEDLKRMGEFQRLFPLGRLVGGCFPDQIVKGSLQCWVGSLVCRENEPTLRAVLPPGSLPDRPLRSAQSLLGDYQYVRNQTGYDRSPDLMGGAVDGGEARAKADDGRMIFSGQSVMRGSSFVHGFTISHASNLELGALLWSLELWAANEGRLGGKSARGHGRISLAIVDGVSESEYAEAVEAYRTHAESVKDAAAEFLRTLYAGPTKEAKGKGRKAKPEPIDESEA